ncbi:MAG: ribokinase [Alphaproteobacteria bacterium]|nr:MAG: ribokinase [Alphaproteobacteria bacterium]
MLSAFLSQVGLPVLIAIVGGALGVLEHPAAKTAVQALGKVEAALKSGQITSEQLAEANRHSEKMAEMEIEHYQTSLSEINKSLRAEIASEDKYVRRMRPTFGYLMAFTWAAQMFGIAYVIIFETDKAGVVMVAMGNLSAIWAVGLSVLGIYVYKRSDDKQKKASRDVIFWNEKKIY